MREMKLQELKAKSPPELLAFAESLEVENASTLRKQDLHVRDPEAAGGRCRQIMGVGSIEVLQDGFGFLRSPESELPAGPGRYLLSPEPDPHGSLRTGDTVEGEIRAPKDGERYFALLKVTTINFDDPEKVRHRVNFDNLTPLYPERS